MLWSPYYMSDKKALKTFNFFFFQDKKRSVKKYTKHLKSYSWAIAMAPSPSNSMRVTLPAVAMISVIDDSHHIHNPHDTCKAGTYDGHHHVGNNLGGGGVEENEKG